MHPNTLFSFWVDGSNPISQTNQQNNHFYVHKKTNSKDIEPIHHSLNSALWNWLSSSYWFPHR